MKKTFIAVALTIAFSPAHAIWDGENLDSTSNNQIVKLKNCSGTVIGNKFVLTAAHCGDGTGSIVMDGSNNTAKVVKTTLNPRFDSNVARVYDVAIWELDGPMVSGFLSKSEPIKDSLYSISGWADGALKTAKVKAIGPVNPEWSEDAFDLIYNPLTGDGTGMSRPGDSGGPCADETGVWGTIQGAGGQGDGSYLQSCQRLTNNNTKQWILETINSWSYPTNVKGEGALTIKVQSVHLNTEVFTPWVDGTLELISNTCSGTVEPLDTCTVQVRGKGNLHIDSANLIEVNKQAEPPQPPTPEEGGNGGGGGGSTGVFSILSLLAAALIRYRK